MFAHFMPPKKTIDKTEFPDQRILLLTLCQMYVTPPFTEVESQRALLAFVKELFSYNNKKYRKIVLMHTLKTPLNTDDLLLAREHYQHLSQLIAKQTNIECEFDNYLNHILSTNIIDENFQLDIYAQSHRHANAYQNHAIDYYFIGIGEDFNNQINQTEHWNRPDVIPQPIFSLQAYTYHVTEKKFKHIFTQVEAKAKPREDYNEDVQYMLDCLPVTPVYCDKQDWLVVKSTRLLYAYDKLLNSVLLPHRILTPMLQQLARYHPDPGNDLPFLEFSRATKQLIRDLCQDLDQKLSRLHKLKGTSEWLCQLDGISRGPAVRISVSLENLLHYLMYGEKKDFLSFKNRIEEFSQDAMRYIDEGKLPPTSCMTLLSITCAIATTVELSALTNINPVYAITGGVALGTTMKLAGSFFSSNPLEKDITKFEKCSMDLLEHRANI